MKTLYCLSRVQDRFSIKDSKLKLNNFVQSMYIQCFALIVSIVRFNDSYRILTGPNIFISNFWIYTAAGLHNNIKAHNNKKRLKVSTPHIWKIYMTPYFEMIMSVLRARSCKRSKTLFKSLLLWLAGEVSWLAVEVLSMSKIKVRIFETKYRSIYKTLCWIPFIHRN